MSQATKVTAYITRVKDSQKQLLVFKEHGHEQLGLQVPGGTVIDGETLEIAVVREVFEESGLIEVRLVAALGECSYRPHNKGYDVQRYYFHLETDHRVDEFTHVVESDDEDNGWVYHYFWIDITQGLPELYGYLGACLDKI